MPRREFIDCRERLNRAREHFEKFAKLWNDFTKMSPTTLTST
jgi:hypothetical protein